MGKCLHWLHSQKNFMEHLTYALLLALHALSLHIPLLALMLVLESVQLLALGVIVVMASKKTALVLAALAREIHSVQGIKLTLS